jgi:hypothetical protein
LREYLAAGRGLTRQPLVAPMGFTLLRFSSERPYLGLHPSSSHALLQQPALRPAAPAPRSFYRLSPGPTRPARQAGRRMGQPFEGSRTGTLPTVRALSCPGYGFTFQRAAHYCQPSADLWAGDLALPESLGSRLRCRASAKITRFYVITNCTVSNRQISCTICTIGICSTIVQR